MKLHMFPVATCIVLLLIYAGALVGCTDKWPVYQNKNFGYTVEYPRDWLVSEPFQNRQMVVIKSPDERDTFSVLVNSSKGQTLEQVVSFYVASTRQGSYYYKLLSDENVTYRGREARKLEAVFQSQSNTPALTVRELYFIDQGKLYLVRFATKLEDINSLAPIYERMFASFTLAR